MPFRVVLDADVLYPASLRDTLLRLAEIELYELYWSERILEEVRRNLVKDGRASEEQAARLLRFMTEAFDGAIVPEEHVAALEPAMQNQPKDRHVLAAAKAAGASAVVTRNIRHFPEDVCSAVGVEALTPDEFLQVLFHIAPDGVRAAVEQQAADLTDPPQTVDDVLGYLAESAPGFAELVANHESS